MKQFAGRAMGCTSWALLAGNAIASAAKAAEPVETFVTLDYLQRPPYLVESGPKRSSKSYMLQLTFGAIHPRLETQCN